MIANSRVSAKYSTAVFKRSLLNLTKAFDMVSRDGVWKVMETFGCLYKFTGFVRQFHDGMIVIKNEFKVLPTVSVACLPQQSSA